MRRLSLSAIAMVLLCVAACTDRGGSESSAPSGMTLDTLLASRVALISPCHQAIHEVRLSMGSSDTWNVVQSHARQARRVCRGAQQMFETLQTPPDQPAAAEMRQQCSAAYQSALDFLNTVIRSNEARSGPDAMHRYESGVARSRGSFTDTRRAVYAAIAACGEAGRALEGSPPAEAAAPAENAGLPSEN